MQGVKRIEVFIIAFILMFQSGCIFSHCDKINLKKSDLDKLAFYDNVKMLIFKTKFIKSDTFKMVLNELSYSPCNKIELSNYQYQKKEIKLVSQNDNEKRILIELNNLYSQDSSAYLKIAFYNAYIDEDDSAEIEFINHKNYINSIECKKWGGLGKYGKGSKDEISTFYWNDSLGIVRYITNKGEVYDLEKKIF